MSIGKRAAAEFVGTFWLVLGGCGSAVLALTFDDGGVQIGLGLLGVSLAFGLTLVSGIYALGHVSGGHFNPAVTMGLVTARRFPARELVPYWVAQVLGAIAAAGVLWLIATGRPDWVPNRFAANGYGDFSPGKYSLVACLVTEVVMTFMFLVVILGATDGRAPKGFAPLAIGLGLTLIHLISIPVTATSVNPARSTGPALFAVGPALPQLWLFWLAPLVGAALAGLAYPAVAGEGKG